MLTLAIDTSSAIAVAVVNGDRVLAQDAVYAPRSHAELLAQMVRTQLNAAGVTGGEVERVVVGTGPAPFTGLRVGLVTARTLAFAWAVPVHGQCSLDAIGAAYGGDVVVVADARRKEVYWATYEGGQRTGGPHVAPPGEVPKSGFTAGRGAGLYPEIFDGPAVGLEDPDPAWLARVIDRSVAAGQTHFPTEPMYLRRPDVHRA